MRSQDNHYFRYISYGYYNAVLQHARILTRVVLVLHKITAIGITSKKQSPQWPFVSGVMAVRDAS